MSQLPEEMKKQIERDGISYMEDRAQFGRCPSPAEAYTAGASKYAEMLVVAEEALYWIGRAKANTGGWDTDCEAYEEHAIETLERLRKMREGK